MNELEAILPNAHQEIRAAVNNIVRGSEHSFRRRTLKEFLRFINFASNEYGQLNEQNFNLALANYRNHCYTPRNDKSVITTDSDYKAFANLMRKLSGRELPSLLVPKSLPANLEVLRRWDKQSCLGYMNPRFWKNEFENYDLPILTAAPASEYLELFISHQREYMNLIKELAREYITQAYSRFQNGQKYAKESNADMFEDPELLDRQFSIHNGQRYSLFSSQLPDSQGLRNLVGYLYHKHQGLISRNFAGANNHLYRFGGRTFLSEHLGLSSDLAAACAVIIVAETGINPESLYNIVLTGNHNKLTSIMSKCDSGKGFELLYRKQRAGGSKKKLVKRDTSNPINAEYCFELLIDVTKPHRTQSNLKSLFIHDSQHREGTITPVSKTAFKSGLKRLINRSEDTQLIKSSPTFAKIRVSGGILAWYDNGGDPRAASRYLGNTTSVALKHYLPREIQEIVYSQQIRAFQNILIAIATHDQDYQQTALSITNKDHFIEFLATSVNNSNIHRLLEKTKQPEDPVTDSDKVTFVLSETNIAMLYHAKILFENATTNEISKELEEWHDFAVLIFKYLQNSDSRRYQAVMRRGIAKAKDNPLNLTDFGANE